MILIFVYGVMHLPELAMVEDEQCTLADAVRFPISSVALRDLPLGVEVRQQRKMQVAV